MTLTVILLSLSDVRLVKQDEHRSHRKRCCIAESLLTWSPQDYLAQAHVHSARALHNLLGLDKTGKRW